MKESKRLPFIVPRSDFLVFLCVSAVKVLVRIQMRAGYRCARPDWMSL
jgi:hypothetical protein